MIEMHKNFNKIQNIIFINCSTVNNSRNEAQPVQPITRFIPCSVKSFY